MPEHEYLNFLGVDHLRVVARLLGLRLPTDKPGMVAGLHQALLHEDYLVLLLDQLNEAELKAVQLAAYTLDFRHDPQCYEANFGILKVENLSLFRFFLGLGSLAPELGHRLKAILAPPPIVELRTRSQLPESEIPLKVYETADAAVDDLRNLLRTIDQGGLKVSAQTERINATSLKVLQKILVAPDYYTWPADAAVHYSMRPYAWPLLLLGAKFVAVGSGGVLELTRVGRTALSSPGPQSLRALWEIYRSWAGYDEFERIRIVVGQKIKKGEPMAPVVPRRAALSRSLKGCPMGEWISVDEFFRYVRASGNDFAVAYAPWMLHVGGSAAHGYLGARRANLWEVLQGRYVLVFLMEYLATLGMVDLAFDTPQDARGDFRELWGMESVSYFSVYDGLRYFRLNPLGAYCLGLEEEYRRPSGHPRLVLDGDLIRGLADTHDWVEAFLERVADPVYAENSEVTWELSFGSVSRATEAGTMPDDVRTFLREQSGEPVPYATEKVLRSVERQLGRCRDQGSARLLRLSLDSARELQKNPLFAKCIFAGDHLVVPAEQEAAAMKTLKKLGYRVAPTYFVEGPELSEHLDPDFGAELIRRLTGQ